MTGFLERVRREDPSVLEELGQQLLPFVQASLLAERLTPTDGVAVLVAFRAAVAQAASAATEEGFTAAVVEQVRVAGAALSTPGSGEAQPEALTTLQRLRPMELREREVVISRFVERLPASAICERYQLEVPALAAILARGVTLLVGAAPQGTEWVTEPSLTDPQAVAAQPLLELENLLSGLAIDATALDLHPLKAQAPTLAPPPALRAGHQPQAPAESYPSQVDTQQLVDLPAVASFLEARPSRVDEEVTARPTISPEAPEVPEVPRPVRTAIDLVPLPLALRDPLAERAALRSAPAPEQTLSGNAPAQSEPLMDSAEDTVARTSVAFQPPPRRVPRLLWPAAAVCAVLSLGLAQWVLRHAEQKRAGSWPLVPVVAVTVDLPEGSVLTRAMVAARDVPMAEVTTSVVPADQMGLVMGQRVMFPLQAGDNLLWGHLESSHVNQRLSPRITRTLRAYTLAVSELHSVSGWVHPGDCVDLVLAFDDSPRGLGRAAITVAQDVPVLAVAEIATGMIKPVRRKSWNVSVLLRPEEAEALGLAAREGPLTITLRGTQNAHEAFERHRVTSIDAVLDAREIETIKDRRMEAFELRRQP